MVRKILVVRTDKMGDVILATPVLEILRNIFCESHIAMLVQSYTEDIIRGNKNVNEILLSDNKTILELKKIFKERKFDAAIVLFPRFKIALALFLAGVKIRIGTAYRWYSFLFNKRVYVHRSRIEKHEVEYNIDLVKKLISIAKIKGDISQPKLSIYISQDDEKTANTFFEKTQVNKDDVVVGIHPGSFGSALNWPVENYAKLADELILTHKYKVLVTGTQKDAELVNTLCKLMMAKPLILPNNFSIKQLAAVLKRCPVFVSGSTGPMHLAAAVDTSTVSLFPPIFVCSPKRWSPWGNKQKILMPEDLSCKICTYDKCKNYNCMQKITVEEVLNNILELLKQ